MTGRGNSPAAPPAPRSEEELEELLSRPTRRVLDALAESPGDVLILGAGGKMGPSLARMVRRAADRIGDGRRVFAASRFSSMHAATMLDAAGVEVVRSELTDRQSLNALPDAPNVIYMAGQKFGTRELPSLTWMTNTVLPALVADRYRHSRIVAFSSGNVYSLVPVTGPGSRESDTLAPMGEYAWSCLARERVLEHGSRTRGTPVAIVRLNYAVDLRYGVLVDLAAKVLRGEAVDTRMGFFNCIWQGDANAMAIACLPLAAVPPFIVNVTGPERLSVRETALELARTLGVEATFTGTEQDDALLSNTTHALERLGPPDVSAQTLIQWVCEWLRAGGTTSGKPTRFEEREGGF